MPTRVLLGSRSAFKIIAAVVAALALLVSVVPPTHAQAATVTSLSGTIRTPDGELAAGAFVCASDEFGEWDACVYANEVGAYEITADNGLQTGSARLSATVDAFLKTYYSSSGSTTDSNDATAVTIEDGVALGDLDITVASGTGITGTATLSDSGSREIWVEICEMWDDEEGDCESASVSSPSESRYSIGGLSAGNNYRVRIRAVGYATAVINDVEVIDGQLTALDPVTLTKLDPGAITGTVVDTSGAAIPGVDVNAYADGVTVSTTTDQDGNYSFTDLPSGVWWDLEFSKTGYASGSDGGMLNPGQTRAMGTIRLARSASLGVQVQTTAHAALSGAELRLCSGDNGDEGCVWGTDSGEGNYSFAGIKPGSYFLHGSAGGYLEAFYPGVKSIADATPIRVTEGGTVTLSAAFVLTRPASIAGTVTYSDASPASSRVGLFDSTGAEIDHGYTYGSGGYGFDDLWPGDYAVQAESFDGYGMIWLGGASTFAQATKVTLSEATQATGKNLALPRQPMTVTGTVRQGADPIAGATITFDTSGDDGAYNSADTDSDGVYSMTLPAGSYVVAASVNGVDVCGPDGTVKCFDSAVVISTDHLVVDLTLSAQSATLSGAISATEGTSWFSIQLLDSSRTRIASQNWEAEYDGSMPTSYSFAHLPYGDYTLRVRSDSTEEYSIDLNAAAVTHDVAVNATSRTIAGTLTTPGELSWAEVVAVNTSTGKMWSRTLEDVSAGSAGYTVGVEPGTYKVLVRTSGEDVWYSGASTMAGATPVTVADTNLTGIDVTLPKTRFTVTGTVELPEGMTAEAASQYLSVWFADPDVTSVDTDADTYAATVDSSGNYSVSLPVGSYRPHAEASATLGTIAAVGDAFEVNADRVGPAITITKGGSLQGRVVAADGIAVGNAEITVTGADGISDQAYADELGYWHLDGVSAGTATVRALGSGYVSGVADPAPSVVAGQTATVATITLAQAARLYVEVPDPDISWVRAVVTNNAGDVLRDRRFWADDGVQLIDSVPVGTVKVRFEGQDFETEWWQDKTSLSTATPIIGNSSTAVTLRPNLSRASSEPASTGTVAGSVTNGSGASGHLEVQAESSSTGSVYEAEPNAAGAYQLVAPTGSYTVTAMLCTGYWVASDNPQSNSSLGYCVGGQRVLEWPGDVAVTADDVTSGINFTFAAQSFTATPTPTITGATGGVAALDDVLTANLGTWLPTPDSFTYQWLRDGANIDGATAATYTVTSADTSAELSVKVTASRDGYTSVTKTSATVQGPVGTAFGTAPKPTISGEPKLDSTLTADAGSWDPAPDSLVYTWYAGSTELAKGADKTTYVLTEAEVGKAITVKVTASKAGYEPTTTESEATATVTAETLAYEAPTITGTPTFGETLNAAAGTWTDGATLSYQWYRDGDKITGATGADYTLGVDDVGAAITVKVTGTKTGYLAHTETSAATASVAALTMTAAKPEITGEAKVGVELSAGVTGWTPADATLSYQWSAGGNAIAGATGTTFTPTSAQLGKAITVTVTGSKPGYEQASATSDPTADVVTDKLIAPAPRVLGTAKVGYRLSVTSGVWAPSGVVLAYQWYASGVPVSGATGSSLLLSAGQRGKAMSVRVTGSAVG
ncbi:MAG: carboxypeptidase-like regulatory domain-containing protein, partial [Propionicimonas sp.]